MAPRRPVGLRAQAQRALKHDHMKRVCKQFAAGGLPEYTQRLLTSKMESEIARIAAAFVALQEARHTAEYDVTATFSRLDVLQKVGLARRAFRDWRRVRGRRNVNVFLAALLLQEHWGR